MDSSTLRPFDELNLDEQANIYARSLRLQPNGWGQQTHPDYGRSDHIMFAMIREFGEEATQAAIQEALARIDIEEPPQ
jgi:hypothetical protein